MTMNWSGDPEGIYSALGVKRVISASGSTTAYGGSKTRAEILDAMNKASRMMVSLDDLNRAASRIIADATGAEAGFVSSGAAGGLVLQAAAVIAGSDPAKMDRLPDSTGMKNEIIIHKSHRFPYDQCYTSVGAKFVEIGDGRTMPALGSSRRRLPRTRQRSHTCSRRSSRAARYRSPKCAR